MNQFIYKLFGDISVIMKVLPCIMNSEKVKVVFGVVSKSDFVPNVFEHIVAQQTTKHHGTGQLEETAAGIYPGECYCLFFIQIY
nr:hypothetical protein [uncultured Arsenicibacter sp.]